MLESEIAAVQELVEHLFRLTGRLRGTRDADIAFLALLHARIMDLAGSLPSLMRADSLTAINAIVRVELDAYIDFELCMMDPTHRKNMYLRYVGSQIKYNQFLLDFLRDEGGNLDSDKGLALRNELRSLRTQRKELIGQGARVLEPAERFKAAWLRDVHATLYAAFSDEIHSDLAVLFGRYSQVKGRRFSIRIGGEDHSQRASPAITMGLVVPVESVTKLLSLVGQINDRESRSLHDHHTEVARKLALSSSGRRRA